MLTKNLCYFSFKKNCFYYDEWLNKIDVPVVSLIDTFDRNSWNFENTT